MTLPRAHVRAPWFRVALARARAASRAIFAPLAWAGATTMLIASGFALATYLPRKQVVTTCIEKNLPEQATVRQLADEYAHNDPRFERALQDAVETYGADALECALQRAEGAP